MQKRPFHNAKSVLHFKKWTHKASAVLVSLKHVVNISVLDFSISGVLGDKSKHLTATVADIFAMALCIDEDEIQQQEMIAVPVIASADAEGARTNLYTHEKACPEIPNRLFLFSTLSIDRQS